MTLLWLSLALVSLALLLLAPRLVRAEAGAEADRLELFPERAGRARFSLAARCPLPVYLSFEWQDARPLRLRGSGVRRLGWRRVELHGSADYLPHRRGVFALPAMRLVAGDLLGLATREVPLPQQAPQITVYPVAFPLGLPEAHLTLLAEGPEAPLWGVEDSTSFTGVREYAGGDPLSRVHWPSTAKHGRAMVKEFARLRATGLWVHLDSQARSPQSGYYLEHAASLASSLLREALELGFRIGLSAGPEAIPLGNGEAQLRRCLALLARAGADPEAHPVPELPAGVNLAVITHHAALSLIEDVTRARARAARVHLIALPEGFYLKPGERGRTLFHRPDSVKRLLDKRALLVAQGVRVHLLRGNENVWTISDLHGGPR